MDSNSHEIVWPKFELEEQDLFSTLPQLTYPDFSNASSIANGYPTLEWQNELPLQESCFVGTPSLESFHEPDHSCALMDVFPSPDLIQGDVFWDVLYSPLFEPEKPMLLCDGGQISGEESMGKNNVIRRYKEEKRSSSKLLSRSTISTYFYLPITQAAKELDVGLTFLKKRCRELGIRRWPHRKLMSLQTLINNLHEYEREKGEDSEGKLRESIEILKIERKMMEEVPDLEMEDHTKRLRQACFKANYKKRKFMGLNNNNMMNMNMNMNMMDAQSSSSSSSDCSFKSLDATTTVTAHNHHHENGTLEEDGDIKSLSLSTTHQHPL